MSKRTKQVQKKKSSKARGVFDKKYIVRNILTLTMMITVVVVAKGAIAIKSSDMAMADKSIETEAASTASLPVTTEQVITTEEARINTESAVAQDKLGATYITASVTDAQNEDTMTADKAYDDETYTDEELGMDADEYGDRFIATAGGVNIRSGAGTDYKVVGYLVVGMPGEILGTSGDWAHIKVGDLEGYVKSEFLLTGKEAAVYAKKNNFSLEQNVYFAAAATEQEVTTQAPATTAAPTTEAPITEAPTTQAPATTEAPTTEAPTTEQASTDVGVTTRGNISVTDEEIKLMIAILSVECGSDTYEGQLAVANVILNRVETGKWGSTVTSVLYARGQFTSVNTNKFQQHLQNGGTATTTQAVYDALAGKNNAGSYLSFRPKSYVNSHNYGKYSIIGAHVFF